MHILIQFCTGNAAKAKRLRKGVFKAAMVNGGSAGPGGGARADNKTSTSKDRTEDGGISTDPSMSQDGLKDDEPTPTSAAVRLSYRNDTEAPVGATGATELVPMMTIDSARAGEEDLEG